MPFPAFLQHVQAFPMENWLLRTVLKGKRCNNNETDQFYIAIKDAIATYDEDGDDRADLLPVSLALPRLLLLTTNEHNIGGNIFEQSNKGAMLFLRTYDEQSVVFDAGGEISQKCRFRFFTEIEYTNRGFLRCRECTSHHSRCEHIATCNLILNGEKEIESADDHSNSEIPRAARNFILECKVPLPLSRFEPFSNLHNMDVIMKTATMTLEELPDNLQPFKSIHDSENIMPRCMCKLNVELPEGFCPCQVDCQICGSPWNPIPEDDGFGYVYLQHKSKKISLKCFRCSSTSCSNKKIYNGHGDGLVVLYKNQTGEKIIINSYIMILIAEEIFKNTLTIRKQWEKVAYL